jgi:signal transduction histidine kinase
MSQRREFRDLSLQHQLVLLLMLTSGVALLVACTTFGLYDWWMHQQASVRSLVITADMIGSNSTASLAFQDVTSAEEILSSLGAASNILTAAIYRKDGALFARYARPGSQEPPPLQSPPAGYRFAGDRLFLSRPILLDQRPIGAVYLQADAQIHDRLRRYAGAVAVVLLLSSLVAFGLGSRLQRLISGPLLRLAGTATLVSTQRDYTIREVRGGDNEIGFVIDSFNNMLDQIQDRDQALRSARDDLELRVDERTRALQAEIAQRTRTQQELLVAKQVAEEANRSKSMFLANTSHELRTPLNAIIGYSEMLLETAEDEALPQFIPDLQKIRGAGLHQLGLVNSILDLSKIEAGHMDLFLETFDLPALVSDVVGTVHPLAGKNSNTIEVDCPADLGDMHADAVKMRQSLLNLLSNACKFTDHGVISLDVASEASGGQEWIRCRVRDTGIGIDPEQICKLFQPFSQVDVSTTRKYGGTGLGLDITRKFCRLMGGDVTVESALGEGSTFTLLVPRHLEPLGESYA